MRPEESVKDPSIGLGGLLESIDGHRFFDSVSVVFDAPGTGQERQDARPGEEASVADHIESGAVGVDSRLASGGKGGLHDLGVGINRRTGTEELPFAFDVDGTPVETGILDSLCELLVEELRSSVGTGQSPLVEGRHRFVGHDVVCEAALDLGDTDRGTGREQVVLVDSNIIVEQFDLIEYAPQSVDRVGRKVRATGVTALAGDGERIAHGSVLGDGDLELGRLADDRSVGFDAVLNKRCCFPNRRPPRRR